jgi:hypothetical protein
MATKKPEAEGADDLLGGTPPADDLLAADAKPTKAKGKAGKAPSKAAKPAGKAAKPAGKATPAKPASKPAAKAAGKAAPAKGKPAEGEGKPAAKAAKKAAAKFPKAPKGGGARGVRGQGAFYPDPAIMEPLKKQVAQVKKAMTTKELAEKFNVKTWQARLAAADLVKNGKGKLEKSGSVLVYTP